MSTPTIHPHVTRLEYLDTLVASMREDQERMDEAMNRLHQSLTAGARR